MSRSEARGHGHGRAPGATTARGAEPRGIHPLVQRLARTRARTSGSLRRPRGRRSASYAGCARRTSGARAAGGGPSPAVRRGAPRTCPAGTRRRVRAGREAPVRLAVSRGPRSPPRPSVVRQTRAHVPTRCRATGRRRSPEAPDRLWRARAPLRGAREEGPGDRDASGHRIRCRGLWQAHGVVARRCRPRSPRRPGRAGRRPPPAGWASPLRRSARPALVFPRARLRRFPRATGSSCRCPALRA